MTDVTYPNWFARQPIEIQNEIFGVKKSALFRKQIRKGKNPTDVFRQFVREDGTEYTRQACLVDCNHKQPRNMSSKEIRKFCDKNFFRCIPYMKWII